MEDALGGVALLVAGVIIWLTGWVWVDSVLGLALGAFVLRAALRIVLKSVNILLEGTPKDISPAEIEAALLTHPSVESVHHLHVWGSTRITTT